MKEYEIYSQTDFANFVQSQQRTFSKSEKFKPFFLIRKEIKDRVSRQQQKYIFGVLYPQLRQGLIDAGYETVCALDDDELDQMLRQLFYYKQITTSKGVCKIPKRLSFGLGKKAEVSKYIDDLLHFAANKGIYIEAPQDDWYIGGAR